MYLIKYIYYVYIYLLLGILKLKKGIKLILFLEMYVKKLEKKFSGVCWILFLYKNYLSLAIGKFVLEF